MRDENEQEIPMVPVFYAAFVFSFFHFVQLLFEGIF